MRIRALFERTIFLSIFLTFFLTLAIAPPVLAQISPPEANAGIDRTVAVGDVVVLDGSASTDPKEMTADFAWRFISYPTDGSAWTPTLSDPAAVKPRFEAFLAGDYVVELVLTEGRRISAPDTVTISTSNSAPRADAGPDQAVTLGSGMPVVLDGSDSTDPDGDSLTFSWALVQAPAGSAASLPLDDRTSVTRRFFVDLGGTYVAELTVDDGVAGHTAVDTVTISTGNVSPVAAAGPDITAKVGDKVQLDGSLSHDRNGDQLSYSWALISVPVIPFPSAEELASQNDVRSTLVVDKAGLFLVQLTVTDTSGAVSRDTLTVSTINAPPAADAGADQVVQPGDTVELDAGHTTDWDGDLLGFRWALVSRPAGSAAMLNDPVSVRPKFTADVAGTYVAQLIVDDGMEPSAPDTVVITTGNALPVADAGPPQTVATRQVVQLDALTGTRDANLSDTLTYSWTVLEQPNGNRAVISDATSPTPTFTFTKFGEHVLQVTVSDGERSHVDTVLITTINSRPFASAGAGQFAAPGDTINLARTGSGDVDNDPLAFRWAIIARPEGSTATLDDPASRTPSFTADVEGYYLVQLIAREASVTNPLTIPKTSLPATMVVDAPAPPVAVAELADPNQTPHVDDIIRLTGANSSDPQGDPLTFAWSFVSRPAASLAVLTGDMTATPSFTPDVFGAYVVQLTVSDGKVSSAPDLITVSMVNRPPVAEAGADQSVTTGALAQLDGSVSSDPDHQALTYAWRFTAKPAGSLAVLLNPTAVNPNFTADVDGLYVLDLAVNDGITDALIPDTVAVRAGSSMINTAPVLALVGARTVQLGSALTFTLSATDADGDPVSFFATPLPLPANATLDAASGLFTFRPAADQVGAYTIAFGASDGLDSDSESVPITVTAPPAGTVTTLSARVLDADSAALGQEVGVAGATIALLGTSISAVTAVDGSFTLSNVPAGARVLDIIATTATPFPDPAPNGTPYASRREGVTLLADAINAADPFFLARLDLASQTVYTPAGTTTVTNTALNTTVAIAPNSATNPDGTPFAGTFTISDIPTDEIAALLPAYISPCNVITFQSDPATRVTFNPGASVTLGNPDGLPPGSVVDIWGIPPSTGQFILAGTGIVSADGLSITTSALIGATPAVFFVIPRPPSAVAAIDMNGFNKRPTLFGDGNLSRSLSLPNYMSLGAARSQTLVYNSSAADPRPVVAAEVTFPANTGLPPTLEGRLEVGGVEVAGPVFTGTGGYTDPITGVIRPPLVAGQSIRQGLQFGASALPTGSYPYRYVASSKYSCSKVGAVAEGRVIVNNQKDSSFGPGWTLDGLQRLNIQDDGHVVLDEGDGSILDAVELPPEQGLVNGSVEEASVNPGGLFIELPPGSTAITAWVTGGGSIDYIGTYWQAAEGIRSIDLNQRSPGSLAQTFPTVIDRTYAVRFNMAGNPDCPPAVKNFQVSLASAGATFDAHAFSFDMTGKTKANMGYVERAFSFVAIDTQTTIAFASLTASFCGAVIDNVSATHVPQGLEASYDMPPGDFSTLERHADGSFTRRMPDGTVYEFDTQGRLTAGIDSNGNATRYTYDLVSGLLGSITDPANQTTSFGYENSILTSMTDPAGRLTLYRRDAAGNPVSLIIPDGGVQRFAYDANQRMIAEASQRGFVTTHDYGSAGQWVGSGFPDGSSITASISGTLGLSDFDSGLGTEGNPDTYVLPEDRVTKLQDVKGNLYETEVNEFGALIRTTDPIGRTTRFVRDADNLVRQAIKDNDGLLPDGTAPATVTTELDYDGNGNVISQTEAAGTALARTTRFFYEPVFNRVVKITDPTNALADPPCGTATAPSPGVTCFAYDANGNQIGVTDARGGAQSFTHDALGLRLTATDANNNTTSFDYDVFGNLSLLTDPLSNQTRFTRDAVGNTQSVTDGFGTVDARLTAFTYDAMNRVLTETDPKGGITETRYDAAGNVIAEIDETGIARTSTYDEMDRLASETHPATGTVQRTYDANGNLATLIDPLGNIAHFRYDAVNRADRTEDPELGVRLFAYDLADNPKTVADANGNATAFKYDLHGREIERANALGDTWTFAYDSRDNMIGTVDAVGQTVAKTFDELSRLTSMELVEVDGLTTEDTVTFGYDALGQKTSAVDGDSSLAWTYDGLNRVATAETVAAIGAVQPAVTLTHGYDAVGNRESLTHGPDALTVAGAWGYLHDGNGALTRVTTPANDTIELFYDLARRLERIAYPTAAGMTVTYDALSGRPDHIAHATGTAALASFDYGFDTDGKILSIADSGGVRSFTYDKTQQLKTGGYASAPESYAYDAEGNRTTSHLSVTYAHDAANRLREDADACYDYDANGNLTTKRVKIGLDCVTDLSGATTTYTWDVLNRLTRIDFADATFAAYRYDAQGRRIEKDVNNLSLTRYVYDDDAILLEYDGANLLLATYSHGEEIDQPLAMTRGANSWFYHTDHLGSIRLLTNAAGTVANNYDYDAFGNLEATSFEGVTNPYAFTARERDAESGLMFYRARYYNPETGRFISEDPIGFEAADFNLYRYIFNNPLAGTDPTGQTMALNHAQLAVLLTGGTIVTLAALEISKSPVGTLSMSGGFLEGVFRWLADLLKTAFPVPNQNDICFERWNSLATEGRLLQEEIDSLRAAASETVTPIHIGILLARIEGRKLAFNLQVSAHNRACPMWQVEPVV